jgi:AcrR family transcriptional regulator
MNGRVSGNEISRNENVLVQEKEKHDAKADSSAGPEIELRRQPVQGRSKERVDTILMVATDVICEVGIQGTKTSEIARRAGISLPSLYRYFPNKSAIIKELAQRHIEKLDVLMQGFVEHFDLDEGFDRLIDVYADFYRTEPGYKEIWSGVESMPELQELDLGELYANARDLSKAAHQRFPHIEEKKLWLICVMLPRVCGSILRLVMTMEKPLADAMLAELKLMVKTYIHERMQSLSQ